jgi:hypothetical protein
MKRLPLVAGLGLAALSLYFSATGLVHLFAGAGAAIVVMACAFELSKIATTVYLAQHFRLRLLSVLLGGALLCLSGVSSLGVYSYLGSAYAAGRRTAATGASTVAVLTEELRQLEADRARLYAQVDAVPATHSTARQRLLRTVQPQIRTLDSAVAVKREVLGKARITQVATEQDIGELRFAAELFGTSQDGLAKLVVTVLAFLLDPLAVMLLLASGVKRQAAVVPETEVEPEPDVLPCTRTDFHDGPCNGWPRETCLATARAPSTVREVLAGLREPMWRSEHVPQEPPPKPRRHPQYSEPLNRVLDAKRRE